MLCIQETKKEIIDKSSCRALWGDNNVRWEMQPASNTAGGILCLRSERAFKLQSKVIGSGFILLNGQWLKEDQQVHIVIVYSPCDIQNKRVLWDNIKQLKSSHNRGYWCIFGDFNNVRNPSERLGNCHRGEWDNSIKEFNDWIDEMEVEDATWVGRKFTWYRPNGSAKSKLDRFLVSHDWVSKWPATTQVTLDRNFSDHCPFMLRSNRLGTQTIQDPRLLDA